jgi:RNA polymerase sigma-70 factor (sigma-E family)
MADEEAFKEFVTARWGSLVRRAYLLTGDHGRAEDLVQSTLERMHKSWRRIERKDVPDAYAIRVMTNLAISNSRRLRFREISMFWDPDVATPDGTGAIGDRDEIWQALRDLPPRMRAVLVLRYLDDLSEQEVARILGCGVGTVKSQCSRGLARMRNLIPAPTDEPRPGTDRSHPATLSTRIVEGVTR